MWRRAFTLVELLVVIAIIGILMSMTLPAIQSARESGRRTQCLNNVRNMGGAALQHLTANNCYPSGGWGFNWAPDPDLGFGMRQPGSWMYSILPYMEEVTLHQLGKGLDNTAKRNAGQQRAMTALPIFHCPTRRRAELYTRSGGAAPNNMTMPAQIARSDYAGNGGDNGGVAAVSGDETPGFASGSETKSVLELDATMRSSFAKNYSSKGIIVMFGQVKESHVKDGTSKTYLLGERHIYFDRYDTGALADDNEGWVIGYNNDCIRWTSSPPESDNTADTTNAFSRWGAPHLTGFNIVFCDGSVRTIPFDIDPGLHQVLGNRADSQTISGKTYDLGGLAN